MPNLISNPKSELWQNFISLRNFDEAWAKVRSNGGCAGGDNMTIDAFGARASSNLQKIVNTLKAGEHKSNAYRRVEIPKPKGGTRILMIPSIEDRIVHTALALVLTPIFELEFEDSSFAYREGRSVQQAVAQIGKYRDAGYVYVVEADIVKYFDNISHDLLIKKIEALIEDADILDLVVEILDEMGLVAGRLGKGLAQGSPLSPLLANLYLDAVDERLDGKGARLVRFADDFVILCKKEISAERALERARDALAEHGLDLHEQHCRVVDFDRGFEFLGHRFIRSFALPSLNEDSDVVSLLREIAGFDKQSEAKEAQEKVEKKAGYDRGERVLYVIEAGRKIGLRNMSFAIENAEGREMAAIAHTRVDRIEVGSNVKISDDLISHCLATDTALSIVDGYGVESGSLVRTNHERAKLQFAQAQMVADPEFALAVSIRIADARVRNMRTQLFRSNREHGRKEVDEALKQLKWIVRKLPHAETIHEIRGLEGRAAAIYWPAFGLLTKGANVPFRRKREKPDMVNGTINYLTAIVLRDCRAAIIATGLHSGFGVLHATRDYAEALVYDLMEPFRGALTEGLACYLWNSRRLRGEMFNEQDDGTMRMKTDARRALIKGYESAVAKRVNVTGARYKLAWRPMMRYQARSFAKAVQSGDPSMFHSYLMEA